MKKKTNFCYHIYIFTFCTLNKIFRDRILIFKLYFVTLLKMSYKLYIYLNTNPDIYVSNKMDKNYLENPI